MRALPVPKYKLAPSTDEIRLQQVINIEATQAALEGMHKEMPTEQVELVSVRSRLTTARPTRSLSVSNSETLFWSDWHRTRAIR